MEGITTGEYISKDLTDLLSKHTTLKDAASIEADTKISSSLILKVKNGTSKVTDGNRKAIEMLVKKAYKNLEAFEKEAIAGKIALKSILDCI